LKKGNAPENTGILDW